MGEDALPKEFELEPGEKIAGKLVATIKPYNQGDDGDSSIERPMVGDWENNDSPISQEYPIYVVFWQDDTALLSSEILKTDYIHTDGNIGETVRSENAKFSVKVISAEFVENDRSRAYWPYKLTFTFKNEAEYPLLPPHNQHCYFPKMFFIYKLKGSSEFISNSTDVSGNATLKQNCTNFIGLDNLENEMLVGANEFFELGQMAAGEERTGAVAFDNETIPWHVLAHEKESIQQLGSCYIIFQDFIYKGTARIEVPCTAGMTYE